MHDLDKLLLVHYKCDRKHRWSVDVSMKEEWYKFPSKLSARLFNNLVATLNMMIEDLKKCSSKEVVYVHTGINKKNIVMNKSGVFKFIHHKGIHAAKPNRITDSYNVMAARNFLGKVMPKQRGGVGSPSQDGEGIEEQIISSLASIGSLTESTLQGMPLPIRLKHFLLHLPLPKVEVKAQAVPSPNVVMGIPVSYETLSQNSHVVPGTPVLAAPASH